MTSSHHCFAIPSHPRLVICSSTDPCMRILTAGWKPFFPSAPPFINELLLGWGFGFCRVTSVSPWKSRVPWAFESHCKYLSRLFCLQVNLIFSHSSGHFQVFVLIKEWECGLLSPLHYLTSLLEGKKGCSGLSLQSIGKNSGAKQMLQFYFPSQPQGRIHIYSWTTFLNTASCIILVGCLAS